MLAPSIPFYFKMYKCDDCGKRRLFFIGPIKRTLTNHHITYFVYTFYFAYFLRYYITFNTRISMIFV